jgi:hypothetical protein
MSLTQQEARERTIGRELDSWDFVLTTVKKRVEPVLRWAGLSNFLLVPAAEFGSYFAFTLFQLSQQFNNKLSLHLLYTWFAAWYPEAQDTWYHASKCSEETETLYICLISILLQCQQ